MTPRRAHAVPRLCGALLARLRQDSRDPTAARVEALKANKGGALVAIDAEIAAIKSEVHAPTAPPDLPSSLAGARREFVAGFGAAEKAVALRVKDLNTKYLQALTTLGQQAESQKNAALAAAVGRRSLRPDRAGEPVRHGRPRVPGPRVGEDHEPGDRQERKGADGHQRKAHTRVLHAPSRVEPAGARRAAQASTSPRRIA